MISNFHRQQREIFKSHGIATPELDSRLLICAVCGLSHEQFILQPDFEISPEHQSSLDDFQARRLKGEPISRILGRREFWGRDFLLGSETLDPRPDSETLIEAVLSHPVLKQKPPERILDLGTGTGALLLTLLLEWPQAQGFGVDKSHQAIEIAQKNSVRLGCDDRVQWGQGSWFEPVTGKYDLIISNPPYIVSADIADLAVEVAEYDPVLALDGGQSGLVAYQDIIKDIHHYLQAKGIVIFELGKGQYNDVHALILAADGAFSAKTCVKYKDLAGVERCLLGQLSQ